MNKKRNQCGHFLKVNIHLFLLLIVMGIISCGQVTNKNYDKWLQKNEDQIINEVLKLPEKDIDLGCILLVFAKDYYPNLNAKKYLYVIDKMAIEIRSRINKKEPEEIIQVINNYIYKTGNFNSSLQLSRKTNKGIDKGFFLNKVLDANSGTCFGLSSLYLAIAERLNLPLYGVVIPYHFFVRYDNGEFCRNIETTKNGTVLFDEYYIEPFVDENNIYLFETKEDIEFAGYLKNLSKRDIIATFLEMRGTLYYEESDKRKAFNDWEKAIKIASNSVNIRKIVAKYISFQDPIRDEDYNKAMCYLNKAIEISPTYYSLYELKGWFYMYQRELEPALLLYNKAIDLNPTLSKLYYSRGIIYERMKEYDKAIENFNKGIAINPACDTWHLEKAMSLFYLKDYNNALDEIEIVIKLNSKYAEAYYLRGLIYKRLGKKNEALKDFNYYLELEPKSTKIELVQQYIKELQKSQDH
jgi:regulator of sirC expression with transglutaminase-like and TPR domain